MARDLIDQQDDAINRLAHHLGTGPTRPVGATDRQRAQMAGDELGIAWHGPTTAARTPPVEDVDRARGSADRVDVERKVIVLDPALPTTQI
jgi:hypothetical protein